jgi:50S ribosomal subunit-associated GTPase HflX
VLQRLEIDRGRVITVFNKVDLLPGYPALPDAGGERQVYVSALAGAGIAALKEEIFRNYFADYERFQLRIADERQLDALNQWAIIVEKSRVDGGFEVVVLSSRKNMLKFREKHGGPIP